VVQNPINYPIRYCDYVDIYIQMVIDRDEDTWNEDKYISSTKHWVERLSGTLYKAHKCFFVNENEWWRIWCEI
jgi:hypothetical protein